MKQDTATSSDEKIDKIAEWLFEDWKKTLNEILLFEFEGRRVSAQSILNKVTIQV